MSDFTVEDVREFFTGQYEYPGPFEDGFGEFLWMANRTPDKSFDITLRGQTYRAVIVEHYDDNREWENHMHYVFEIEGRMFKFPGKFVSHDGAYWDSDDITEGRLVTKPVMVWE